MTVEIPNGEGFKYEYQRTGNPLTSNEQLLEQLKTRSDQFPHIEREKLRAWGKIDRSGVVITNGDGVIVAAVKHPRQIPDHILDRRVIFGGRQCDNHIELSLEKSTNGSVQNQARMIIEALSHGSVSEVSEIFTGLAAVGSEPEAWVVKPDGSLELVSGGELQMGLNEDSLEPISDPNNFLKIRAQYILDRQIKYPGLSVIDTSVLMTGCPLNTRVNDVGEVGPYVRAIQTRLLEDNFCYSEPLAEKLMNQIAQAFGIENHAMLREIKGDMAYWVMAASHASVGLPHRRTGRNAMWIPEQDAIAVADIFNTNLATAAEFLMMSSPVIYGITPRVVLGDQKYWPRDYRAILRYLMDTTNPSDFIMTPERMHEQIIQLVVNGNTHTIDRASYVANMPDGRMVPVMHGRVRNRMASSEPKNQTGRVEFTGCSASPSLYDELARNCLLQVLTFAAYEALANGQHPVEYYRERYGAQFPNLSRWQEQKELLIQASLFGFNYEPVSQLILETTTFLKHMVQKYQNLKQQVDIASWRLNNLMRPAAKTLEEYLTTNRGPISEVLQNELEQGVDPVILVKKVHDFEVVQAKNILNKNDK